MPPHPSATATPHPGAPADSTGSGHGAKKRFLHDARQYVRDTDHRAFLRRALAGYYTTRDGQKARYRDWEHARDAANLAKWNAVNRLDEMLIRFADAFEAGGGKVHWARDAAEARSIILEIVRAAGAKAIIKSKCMTSEEIHLNAALEAEGYGVVESDLGEFIQQLRGEPPFHFVFPCMHVRRGEISKLFEEHLGSAPTESPEELTMIARRYMRRLYVEADVGITGGNFLVAETGQISITENEGNARLTAALPRVHVALVGIEKCVERLDDLAVLLPMLATAGTGQPITCYNTLYGGPRATGECDGPREMHVVLLDNGRAAILADPEQRDSLQCIRCGACLNVCPIFKNVGGFTYGTTYQGPIGSVITPVRCGSTSTTISSTTGATPSGPCPTVWSGWDTGRSPPSRPGRGCSPPEARCSAARSGCSRNSGCRSSATGSPVAICRGLRRRASATSGATAPLQPWPAVGRAPAGVSDERPRRDPRSGPGSALRPRSRSSSARRGDGRPRRRPASGATPTR
jgi:L-lactate dehydrogenase complex protein LldF